MPRLWTLLVPCLLLLGSFTHSGFALEAVVDGDEYEPPPEGYDEKHYAIQSLISDTYDFPLTESRATFQNGTQIGAEDIMAILRYCVEPESWTRRGPARMEQRGGELVILQKKELHAEIAKVLQWLHDGVKTPFKATVVVAALKPETLAKFRASGASLTSAELSKALEEAGPDALVDISEVRGTEGQAAQASSQTRRSYIADYDVSGAVYDPVVRYNSSGLQAQVCALRTPDCASLLLKLSVSLAGTPEMTKAHLDFANITAMEAGATSTTELKVEDKSEKKDEKKDDKKIVVEVHEPNGKTVAVPGRGSLELELPNQVQGKLATSLVVPRNAFVLAGVMDFSLVAGKPDRRAVFVKASAGPEGVPTLLGVSGLKEGESFRLYPLSWALTESADFPGPELLGLTDVAGGAGAMVNGFTAAPAQASAVASQVRNVQKLFAEKVRKNKVVDPHGSVVFTRLTNADHALFLKNIKEEQRSHLTPLRVRAVAVAVSPETQHKLALEDAEGYDPAAIDALAAANGAQVLQDSELCVLPLSRAHVYAGMERSLVFDYEISGDSYDPTIRQFLERGGMLDVCVVPRATEPRAEITTRFFTLPMALDITHSRLTTIGVNSGANSSIVMGLKGSLDQIKAGVVNVRATSSVPYGKFVLVGTARMPAADGKPETRQVLLFIKADEMK